MTLKLGRTLPLFLAMLLLVGGSVGHFGVQSAPASGNPVVQQTTAGGTGSSQTLTLPAGFTSGNRLVLLGEIGSSSITVSSISVGTWTAHPNESLDNSSIPGRVVMRTSTDVEAGTTQVTVDLSGSPLGGSTWVLVELDGASAATGTDAAGYQASGASATEQESGATYPTHDPVVAVGMFAGRWGATPTVSVSGAQGFTALTAPPSGGGMNAAQLRGAYKTVSYGPQDARWTADSDIFGRGLIWCFYGPAADSQPIVWKADFDDGTTDAITDGYAADGGATPGGAHKDSGSATATAATELAHSGSYSMKQTITTRHAPTSGARSFRYHESRLDQGRGRYYSGYLYVPAARTPVNFWMPFQFKSRSTGGATGPDNIWQLDIVNHDGSLYLDLIFDGSQKGIPGPHDGEAGFRRYSQTATALPTGQWVFIEIWLKPSDGYTGEINVWQGSTLIHSQISVRTSYTNIDYRGTTDTEPAWCDYSDGFIEDGDTTGNLTTTLYWDDLAISTAP